MQAIDWNTVADVVLTRVGIVAGIAFVGVWAFMISGTIFGVWGRTWRGISIFMLALALATVLAFKVGSEPDEYGHPNDGRSRTQRAADTVTFLLVIAGPAIMGMREGLRRHRAKAPELARIDAAKQTA